MPIVKIVLKVKRCVKSAQNDIVAKSENNAQYNNTPIVSSVKKREYLLKVKIVKGPTKRDHIAKSNNIGNTTQH